MRLLTRALAARTANRAAAVRLLVFFLAATFIVEVAVMRLLPRIVPAHASPALVGAVDAGILTLILGPITWWVFLVPLQRTHDARGLLISRILSAQEDERTRISRDLHDGLGQSLTSILLRLRVLGDQTLSEEARANVASIRQTTSDSLDDLRRLVRETRPPVLADLGLAAALEKQLHEAQEASGIDMSLDWHGRDAARLSPELETVMYRVIQEAVTNAMKHAAAGHVKVAVAVGPTELTAVVADDGVGFDLANGRVVPEKSFGLLGILERLRPFGGTFDVKSSAGRGTTVTARVPLPIHEAQQ